jgi:hypothetical protein
MVQIDNFASLPKIAYEDGQLIPIEHEKISHIIFKALKAAENPDRLLALNLADKVIYRLTICNGVESPLSVEQVYSMMEFVLMESGNYKAAKEFSSNKQVNDPYSVQPI